MKKKISIIFIAIFFFNAVVPGTQTAVYGGSYLSPAAAGIMGLDLSSGLINGDRCEYKMRIPSEWVQHIIIEREELAFGTKILEMLNLYWQPKNHPIIFLANIFIYETRYSAEIGSYKRILETDEYDIRIYVSATEPELINTGDKILHNHFIEQLEDANFLMELFIFPEGMGPVVRDRLFINGRAVDGDILYKSTQPYIPLRLACESLGYAVGWNAADQSVSITNADFEFTLFTGDTQNYGAVMVENSFFVPAIFFIQVLKTNFETDKRGNVFITR